MLQNDRPITISVAGSRWAKQWPPQVISWGQFTDRIRNVAISTETHEAYMLMSKHQQDTLKDVGGYVGGTLKNNRRKSSCVMQRDLITLDMDSIPPGGTDDVLRRVASTAVACVVYSTRKHNPYAPRLRCVFPLAEPCGPEEYEPIARMLAKNIGLEFCDPTTFQPHRLMYWPSCCVNAQFIYQVYDMPMLDGKAVLGMYDDWHDVKSWPRLPREDNLKHGDKLGDPTQKNGIIGAFCREYDVFRALDELLPGVYLPTDMPDRYSYAKGSTSGGAMVYDSGLFLYSHHATDPCSGKEVNAFDLVRLHMFNEMDDDAAPNTPPNKLPSYVAMSQFAVSLPEVEARMQSERYEEATRAFIAEAGEAAGGGTGDGGGQVGAVTVDTSWMSKLAHNKSNGEYLKTVDNVVVIMENDPLLRGKVVFDEFSQRSFVIGGLPWRRLDGGRRLWTDADDSQLIRYVEKVYGITGDNRIRHGLVSYLDSHAINEVRDYLRGLRWDGIPRLDRLFIDYLGAEDTPYVRAVTKKSMCAAVARALQPGIQYDTVPMLRGIQGLGKTTLLRIMGGLWHTDSLDTFDGKEAAELIQGMWIIELGELTAMSKSDTEAAKHFITKKDDQFRVPYGRNVNVFPRRCVFFGTTNRDEYLKDITGNRRFWPVDCVGERRTKNPWKELEGERDQLWAEAVTRWTMGVEKLYLDDALEEVARMQQKGHMELDPRTAMVEDWLNRAVPMDWMQRDIASRRIYWSGEFGTPRAAGVVVRARQVVSRQEIWCECFNRDPALFGRREAADIDSIMNAIVGWAKHTNSFRNGPYGTEKGFIRTDWKAGLEELKGLEGICWK
jgi:putative DNA primase/helicase